MVNPPHPSMRIQLAPFGHIRKLHPSANVQIRYAATRPPAHLEQWHVTIQEIVTRFATMGCTQRLFSVVIVNQHDSWVILSHTVHSCCPWNLLYCLSALYPCSTALSINWARFTWRTWHAASPHSHNGRPGPRCATFGCSSRWTRPWGPRCQGSWMVGDQTHQQIYLFSGQVTCFWSTPARGNEPNFRWWMVCSCFMLRFWRKSQDAMQPPT